MQINNQIQNISLNSNSLGNGATNPNYYYYYYINKANQQKQQQEEHQKAQLQQASNNLIGFLSTPNLATQMQNNKTPTYIKHKQKITSSLNLNTNLSNSYSSLTNRSSLPSSPATYIATTQQSAQIPNSNNSNNTNSGLSSLSSMNNSLDAIQNGNSEKASIKQQQQQTKSSPSLTLYTYLLQTNKSLGRDVKASVIRSQTKRISSLGDDYEVNKQNFISRLEKMALNNKKSNNGANSADVISESIMNLNPLSNNNNSNSSANGTQNNININNNNSSSNNSQNLISIKNLFKENVNSIINSSSIRSGSAASIMSNIASAHNSNNTDANSNLLRLNQQR